MHRCTVYVHIHLQDFQTLRCKGKIFVHRGFCEEEVEEEEEGEEEKKGVKEGEESNAS